MGFKHTILVFERARTVHALDRSATVIGCNLAYSPSTAVAELKMTWAGHVAHMEMKNTREIFVGKRLGGRPRWEDYIAIHLRQIGY
jgi:hypothetical protein